MDRIVASPASEPTALGVKVLGRIDDDVRGALKSAHKLGRGRARLLWGVSARLGRLAATGDIPADMARAKATQIAADLYGDERPAKRLNTVKRGLRYGG